MRITIVIWDPFSIGGAERVMAMLTRLWTANGHSVHIIARTHLPTNADPDPAFGPGVTMEQAIAFELARNWPVGTKTIGKFFCFRRALLHGRPDVVIAFMETSAVKCLLALLGAPVPVIVAVRRHPLARSFSAETVESGDSPARKSLKSRVKDALRHTLYNRAGSVVCQTQSAMACFPEYIRRRGCIIPNPILPPPFLPGNSDLEPDKRPNQKRLVSLGRLVHVKGLNRLLLAYAAIIMQHPDWVLEIWGRGPEEPALRKLAEDLNIASRVEFRGLGDPYDVFRGAEIYVLSSYNEGFPNALCEAMACGVVPVSFDCPSGPRHIIRHGIDGLLVPNGDVAALSRALDRLMSDSVERKRLASRAPEVLERFGAERVLALWDDLFTSLTAR